MQYTGTTFIDEIIKEIGEPITNTNFRLFVLNWLQEGFDIVASELEGHPFLNTVVDLNTVASTNGYNVVSGSLIPGNIVAIRNKTTNKPLSYYDIQDIKTSNWDLESTGDPRVFYHYGYSLTYNSTLIYFYPIPNAVYALEVTYKLNSYLFADSSVVLYIPRYITSMLRMYVRAMSYMREGEQAFYESQLKIFYAQLQSIKKSKHTIADVNRMQVSDLPSRDGRSRASRDSFLYGQIGGSSSGVGVSSITIAVPSGIMSQSGSPLTSAGTITLSFSSQTANKAFMSPDNASGVPSFRSLVARDIPNHQHVSADITDLTIGNEFVDNVFRIKDNSDATKKIAFEASSVGTGTTVTLTIANTSGTIALTSNKLDAFAATTSAELNTVISDNTGSGALVFANTPTLVTPVLGVATATSINGLTLTTSTGVITITNGKILSVSNTLTFTGTDSSSVAFGGGGTVIYTSNKLSALAATTSTELASVISDETGSGLLVFATSPTLTTPILGVATATSINKVAITAPATSATLTIANGKTLTINESLTFGAVGNGKLMYASSANTLAELTLGTNLSITSGTLNASGGGSAGSGVILKRTTTAQFSNTTTETTVFTRTLAVASNPLGANGKFILRLKYIQICTLGTSFTLKLKLNSTTYMALVDTRGSPASLMAEVDFEFINKNATNSNFITAKSKLHLENITSTAPSAFSYPTQEQTSSINTTIDCTADIAIELTITMDTASSDRKVDPYFAELEYFPSV